MCNQCGGTCAKGLPHSDIIRYVSYAEGYGEFQLGLENYRTLPAELQQVDCAGLRGMQRPLPSRACMLRNGRSRARELFA
ncbi:MAG: hypothetical protein U5J83_19410 [Bryobacterales bacterium]|nr:hypothetical protein [Bryobacterales bacterium]